MNFWDEVFHEVIVVVEFDYVDVVFCFRVTNSRHPPFRLIIFRVAFRSKPGGFLRELSQSCVKDVFVGLYAEVGEPRHAVGVQFFAEEEFQFAVVDGCG
jgi:hypothetical protein